MPNDEVAGDPGERHDEGRRSFLKQMAVGGAFVAPTISSFSMTGVSAVYAQMPTASGVDVDPGDDVASSTSSPTTTSSSTTSTSTTTTTIANGNQPTTTTTSTTTTSTTTTTIANGNQTIRPGRS